MCSSSGGQNCIIQHLVSPHSVGGRPVRTCVPDSHLPTELPGPQCNKSTTINVTIQAVNILVGSCNINTILIHLLKLQVLKVIKLNTSNPKICRAGKCSSFNWIRLSVVLLSE